MANEYYTPTTVTTSTKISSAVENTERAAVEAGFDKLPTETELKRSLVNWQATDTGSVNVIALALTHVSAYAAGLRITFIPAFTNTGSTTLNVNGLGPVTILRDDGAALNVGDIIADSITEVIHDGTQFELMNAPAVALTGTASQAEAEAGTENTKSMSPLRVRQAMAYMGNWIDEFYTGEPYQGASPTGATSVTRLGVGSGGGTAMGANASGSNIAIGAGAGGDTGTVSNNISIGLFGSGLGSPVADRTNCVNIGRDSGSNTKFFSVSIGNEATSLNATSALQYSTAVGYRSAGGTDSVAIGDHAMTIDGATESVAIGSGALGNLLTGHTGNVAIGHKAGQPETAVDNKLYIANDTGTPLIEGDFANDWIKVTGHVEATKWFLNPSYNVAGAPSASTAGAGASSYITDGDAGSATLAVSDGTNWKVVALGATISAT